MRKNIVAGNWKMNLNLQEGVAATLNVNEALKDKTVKCDVVIDTRFIHGKRSECRETLQNRN